MIEEQIVAKIDFFQEESKTFIKDVKNIKEIVSTTINIKKIIKSEKLRLEEKSERPWPIITPVIAAEKKVVPRYITIA